MSAGSDNLENAVSASDQMRMAPIAALMYATAGAVVGLSLLLPHSSGMNRGALLGAALVGPITAALIWLWRDRLPVAFFHLTTASGTVLAGLCVYWSGEAGSAYAFLLLWVAVFSAYFFTPRQLALHLAFAGLVYAVALMVHPQTEPDAAAHWLLTMVCIAVASAIISSLVTSRQRLEAERERMLAHTLQLARTDPLTGLLNRRAWRDLLDGELARAKRQGWPMCVAMLDLDHFKRFNDDHGHVAGDAFLEQLASAWAAALRPSDIIARYGGEEFSLLLPDCELDAAIEVIERLRDCVPLDERCSAGVARWDGEERPVELIIRADSLLYEAKRSGRDRLVATVADLSGAVAD